MTSVKKHVAIICSASSSARNRNLFGSISSTNTSFENRLRGLSFTQLKQVAGENIKGKGHKAVCGYKRKGKKVPHNRNFYVRKK
tara:strand:+ start:76 stop:327 length:252 start_codon:yes stop_codon:yes gene_type:complete